MNGVENLSLHGFHLLVQVLPIVPKTSETIDAIRAVLWKGLDRFDCSNRSKSLGQTNKRYGSDNNIWREELLF